MSLAELGSWLAVFVVGVAASVIGAMVGGGSLLSIPLLIFLGLPPQVAIATDRFAGLGGAVTAAYRFQVARKIVWRHVPALAIASLAGSVLGASLLVAADPGSLDVVVGLLLLLLLPLLFLGGDLGVAAREVGTPRYRLGLLLYFAVQVLAGFFGAGTGTLIFYILMSCFRITITQVAATQVFPFMLLSASSVVIFAVHGIIDYRVGAVLLAGTAVGGFLGAHIAIRSGDVWVRRLFAVVVVASAVKLLFF